MDSSDSEFYGDEAVVAPLKQRVDNFDAADWWDQQARSSPTALQLKSQSPPQDTKPSHLHNPYGGCPFAWQLTETVDAFLERLPPATTEASEAVPCIYICNPYIPRKARAEAQNQHSRGNQDEAPEEAGTDLPRFQEGGMERLHLLSQFTRFALSSPQKSAVKSRDINHERLSAVRDILYLAQDCRIRPGKWMIFEDPSRVDETWRLVAKATANNELGIAAKVAPRSVDSMAGAQRLICIYTTNFADKKDVGRVLKRLRELRLVESRSRTIYYKTDAFTYLGISSGNPWNIKSSLYSSRDIIPST